MIIIYFKIKDYHSIELKNINNNYLFFWQNVDNISNIKK